MSTSDATDGADGGVEGEEYRYERAPDERASEAVVSAVAAVTGRPAVPGEAVGDEDTADVLPPLYENIAPEALDALVTSDSDQETDCSVTFTYASYTVTVRKQTVTVTSTT